MASISFTKEFAITQQSTIDRLEKAIGNIQPIKSTTEDVVADMKRSEQRLLDILHSRA